MKLRSILIISVMGLLVGCNQSNTSSGTGDGLSLNTSASVQSPSGSQINMIYDGPVVAGEENIFFFQLRPEGASPGATTATVHWGDNSATRIRDDHSIAVPHTWTEPGDYAIAVQIDGESKAVVSESFAVDAAPSPTPAPRRPRVVAEVFSGSTGRFVGHVCNPAADGTNITAATTGTLTLPNPWADSTSTTISGVAVDIASECSSPFSLTGTVNPGGNIGFTPATFGCTAGLTYEISFDSGTGDTAFCRWTVQ